MIMEFHSISSPKHGGCYKTEDAVRARDSDKTLLWHAQGPQVHWWKGASDSP